MKEFVGQIVGYARPSMKVPPKRKGNLAVRLQPEVKLDALNESPSEKEGKFGLFRNQFIRRNKPSMKVPPKRKGNIRPMGVFDKSRSPQ